MHLDPVMHHPNERGWMTQLQRRDTVSQKLAGKVAVVTGGSSGIGLATAQRFVNEGAYVFITGRRQTELDATVSQIGHDITAVQGDVSKLADIDKLYATVKKEKGTLDIVFANAGTGAFGPIGQITEEDFDKQFDVNVKGLLFTVQKALPLLQDGGSIVLNASIVSIKGNPLGRPGTTDEIAKAISFLASDDSSYVNGIELFVDGGLAQRAEGS